GKSLHQRVDVAIRAGQTVDAVLDPLDGKLPVAGEVLEDPAAEADMRVVGQLAEVGDAAGLPQEPHDAPALCRGADVGLAGAGDGRRTWSGARRRRGRRPC